VLTFQHFPPVTSPSTLNLLQCYKCIQPITGGLYSGPCAEAAARRYEQIWLPLLADTAAKSEAAAGELVPPLDVAYAWLCHRLAPAAYEADCQRLFGRTLDPVNAKQALAFDDGRSTNGKVSTQAWLEAQASAKSTSVTTRSVVGVSVEMQGTTSDQLPYATLMSFLCIPKAYSIVRLLCTHAEENLTGLQPHLQRSTLPGYLTV
jgi:hypothetical protein